MAKLLFLFAFFVANFAQAGIQPKSVKFVYMSTDGTMWVDCNQHQVAHTDDWVATCGTMEFQVHLLLKQVSNPVGTSIEIDFLATETRPTNETHTQSTWITLTPGSSMKDITAYLGFQNDADQLRAVITLP